jgi:hypothetical protein
MLIKAQVQFLTFFNFVIHSIKNVGNVNVLKISLLKTIKTIKKNWNDHFVDHFVKTTYGIQNPKACRGDV